MISNSSHHLSHIAKRILRTYTLLPKLGEQCPCLELTSTGLSTAPALTGVLGAVPFGATNDSGQLSDVV